MLDFSINNIDSATSFFYIDDDARDHEITKEQAIIKIAQGKYTVKLNGLESIYSNYKTVHAFFSPANSVSFPEHMDFEDLKILCVSGNKGFEVGGVRYNLLPGESCSVPKGINHRAINELDSIILSIEVDK